MADAELRTVVNPEAERWVSVEAPLCPSVRESVIDSSADVICDPDATVFTEVESRVLNPALMLVVLGLPTELEDADLVPPVIRLLICLSKSPPPVASIKSYRSQAAIQHKSDEQENTGRRTLTSPTCVPQHHAAE